jgi:hypothetical protein
MSCWTRLRPGKYPRFNRALCDFPRRAFDLRLSREIQRALRCPELHTTRAASRLLRKAARQDWWESLAPPTPHFEEPPF